MQPLSSGVKVVDDTKRTVNSQRREKREREMGNRGEREDNGWE